jgi:hypothetical protein
MAFGQSRAQRKTMSARVVLVHDQPEVCGKVSGALTDASFEVAVSPILLLLLIRWPPPNRWNYSSPARNSRPVNRMVGRSL